MRIQQKGGVWKNTEDEILKAAVMKYGKNQWARISSLLTRKSAKQCKARWLEWLDPSIKKTEWSREEEEKLLHLAKIMPNQWRTIAPAVGRTSAQCIAHYEKLLDAAQNKGEAYDPAEDPRRLRPGEIDPNPESKAAKPDPVDMDEDEKEMLSEARARLANTKGKKAKRKAREKQLEEARRLASLQKRRELKAAGIQVHKIKKKIKGIDYNTEIPFFKKPPPGFYEVDFNEEEEKLGSNGKSLSIDEIDGSAKRKREQEQERKEAAKKSKSKEKKNLPAHIQQVSKINDPEAVVHRTKMMLPAAQLTEDTLAELTKVDGESTLYIEDTEDDDGRKNATKGLLQNYNLTGSTPGATPFRGSITPGGIGSRTPSSMRTPARGDYIMREVNNILALNNIGTPLAGGVNPELLPSDFSGSTPKAHNIVTPNVLATPSRVNNTAMTPSGTPFRDKMGINSAELENASALKAYKKANRNQIREALLKLPAPQNEYSFVLPEDVADEEVEDNNMVEDASDVIKKSERAAEEERQLQLRLRSQVLKRELPRPTTLADSFTKFESKLEEYNKQAEELIRSEVVRLIKHESLIYPNKAGGKGREDVGYQQFTETQLKEADHLVLTEAHNSLSRFSMEEFVKILEDTARNEFVFVPSQSKFVSGQGVSRKDRADSIAAQFDLVRGSMSEEASKGGKIESKINLYTRGYEIRSGNLLNSIRELTTESVSRKDELYAYQKMRELETTAMLNRVNALEREVKIQEDRERDNQSRYRNLITEKQILLANM